MRIKAYTPFTTLLIVCANDTCGGGWLLCIRITLLTVYPISLSLLSLSLLSLSHSGYRYLFAADRATASTFQHMMIHVIVWMVGWLSYIAKVQRHLSLHTSSCASPRWRIGGRGIVLSALQSVILKCRIITLTTLRNVSRLLSILHPTPLTAYYLYLLLVGSRQLILVLSVANFDFLVGRCLKAVSEPVSKVSQRCLNWDTCVSTCLKGVPSVSKKSLNYRQIIAHRVSCCWSMNIDVWC